MIASVVAELGPWNWMALGLVLLALEIVIPGVFMLWIGIAALIVGAISLALWDTSFWTWHWQLLVFLALSLFSAWLGKRMMGDGKTDSDQPLLNQRAAQLVGRNATLHEAIVDGSGRIKIGDTIWRVSGPDLPAGAKVTVSAIDGSSLVVSAI